MFRVVIALASLLMLFCLPVCQAQHVPHFQFIDYTGCEPNNQINPSSPITATATQTTAYLDGGGTVGGPHGTRPIPLSSGVVDGQLLTVVCNSSLAGEWYISGTFNAIDNLDLGGANLGSFDHALTVNPGNGSSGSDQSCGATLMWSSGNGWWELVSIYGGTDN